MALLAVLYCGREFYGSVWSGLTHGTASMDTLIAVGTGAAFAFSLAAPRAPGVLTSRGIQPHVYDTTAHHLMRADLRGVGTAIARAPHHAQEGGYSSNVIEVKKGKLVRLNFYRDQESSCSEELLRPDFHLRRDLPAFQTTAVAFLPEEAGSFEFACGMHMLRGSVVVR